MRCRIVCAAPLLLVARVLGAQGPAAAARRPHLEGLWQAKTGDELRTIMVRSDSSARFGSEVARWRVVGDSLWITLGDGVWQVYGMRLEGDKLTLSGGDLQKPASLKRVGPAAARPDTIPLPAAPPDSARAW